MGKMVKETILNHIIYVNNPGRWQEDKSKLLKEITKLNKLRDFIEKPLSTNFKYLIPNEKCIEDIRSLDGKLYEDGH